MAIDSVPKGVVGHVYEDDLEEGKIIPVFELVIKLWEIFYSVSSIKKSKR